MSWSIRGVLVVVSGLVSVLVLGTFFLYISFATDKGILATFYVSDRVQAGTALVGLVFGTVGTLAGAAASIQVSLLGLRISKSQESFAIVSFLDSKFEKVAETAAALAVSVSDIIVSGIALNASLNEDNIKRFKTGVHDVPSDMKVDIDKFVIGLEGLSAALRRASSDNLTAVALRQVQAGMDLALPGIVAAQRNAGLSESEAWISVDDLMDIVHLIDVARSRLIESPMEQVMAARLVCRAPDLLFGLPFDHSFVRDLLFTGALILNRLEQGPNGLRMFCIGLGILHDLAVKLPCTETVKRSLSEQYPESKPYIDKMMNRVDSSRLLPRYVQESFQAIQSLGLAYVYDGGEV